MSAKITKPSAPLTLRAIWLVAALVAGTTPMVSALAASPAPSFRAAIVVELPRMVVTGLGKGGAAGESVTFVPVLETEESSTDAARAMIPAYRDVILVTTIGYLAFAANHGRPVDPYRLQKLLADRIRASGLPKVTAVLLQSFVFKPEAPTN
ncbi:MAG: hypothetical protein FJX60_09640 [Alphaproteobacteria bacterium]|nr:hypothetical protein [Alphaproteobacteria bacterium]